MKKITWRFIAIIMYGYFFNQKIRNFFVSKINKNPKKIFCIGSIKTGTSSLYKAFRILGYKSVKLFEVPLYFDKGSKKYVDKIKKSGFEVFVDYPIGDKDLYKIIDKQIPNSKFILTIRDPKSHKISYSNYFKNHPWPGIRENITETIIEMKKREQEVINYFKNRENDLLIINIIKGEGWEKICKFLGKPIPNKPFPRKNVGKYRKQK